MKIGDQVTTPQGKGRLTAVAPIGDGNTVCRVNGYWWDSRVVFEYDGWVCFFEGTCPRHGDTRSCRECLYWLEQTDRICEHADHCLTPGYVCRHKSPHPTERLCTIKICKGESAKCVPWVPAPKEEPAKCAPGEPPVATGRIVCQSSGTCPLAGVCGWAEPHAYQDNSSTDTLCEPMGILRHFIPTTPELEWRRARIRYDGKGEGRSVEIRFGDGMHG